MMHLPHANMNAQTVQLTVLLVSPVLSSLLVWAEIPPLQTTLIHFTVEQIILMQTRSAKWHVQAEHHWSAPRRNHAYHSQPVMSNHRARSHLHSTVVLARKMQKFHAPSLVLMAPVIVQVVRHASHLQRAEPCPRLRSLYLRRLSQIRFTAEQASRMRHLFAQYHALLVPAPSVPMAKVVTDIPLAMTEKAFIVEVLGMKLRQRVRNHALPRVMTSAQQVKFALGTRLVIFQKRTLPSSLSFVVPPLKRLQ